MKLPPQKISRSWRSGWTGSMVRAICFLCDLLNQSGWWINRKTACVFLGFGIDAALFRCFPSSWGVVDVDVYRCGAFGDVKLVLILAMVYYLFQ
ncbi:hypothetical protein HDV62DRAFT_189777 [Trichoderma sp. SZMC 28011]